MDKEIVRELKQSVDAWVKFQGRRSADLSLELKEQAAEIERLKSLLRRAADALVGSTWQERDALIAELRNLEKGKSEPTDNP
jgi:hypothetical protein